MARNEVQPILPYIKKKKVGTGNMSLGEWCLDHKEIPDDLEEAFVVEYNIFS